VFISPIGFDQVLADEGKAKAVAFDEIDKAPEEKKRGITIATVRLILSDMSFWSCYRLCYFVSRCVLA